MAVLDAYDLERCGIFPGSHVLAAVSGGADSTALLLLLVECLDRGMIGTLSAAHFNHQIRGKDADDDEQFCRELCKHYAVPFYSGRGDVPGYAQEQKCGIESAARILRYAYLRGVMAEIQADCIVTAHHADDQAETVLQHLLRGTGPKGLCGMAPRAGDVARPLLHWSRREILDYLSERSQAFRRDETNQDVCCFRNRLRLEIIPLLQQLQPKLVDHLCDLAGDIRLDEDYFHPLVTKLIEDSEIAGGFDRTLLRKSPEAIRRRALIHLLNEVLSFNICRNDVKSLDWLLYAPPGRRVTLSNGVEAWNDGLVMRIGKPEAFQDYSVELKPGGTAEAAGWLIHTEYAEAFRKPSSAMEAFITVHSDRCRELLARRKRNGDRFWPLGMKGSRLLSDIYTDRKYSERMRTAPIICLGEEIVFVPGYTVAESVRVTPESRNIIHILVEEATES